MGDLNIALLEYNIHSKTNNLVDNVFHQGLLPMTHKPTRITFTCASLIDHIYSNNLTQNSLSGIIITDISDHFGTFNIEHTKIYSSWWCNWFQTYLLQSQPMSF